MKDPILVLVLVVRMYDANTGILILLQLVILFHPPVEVASTTIHKELVKCVLRHCFYSSSTNYVWVDLRQGRVQAFSRDVHDRTSVRVLA